MKGLLLLGPQTRQSALGETAWLRYESALLVESHPSCNAIGIERHQLSHVNDEPEKNQNSRVLSCGKSIVGSDWDLEVDRLVMRIRSQWWRSDLHFR